jgi:hypothetical protein
MNKTLKYFGILAILPLLTIAFTIDYFGDAEGTKAVGPKGAKSYGSKTSGIVCGDRLCSEAEPTPQASSSSRATPSTPIPGTSVEEIEEKIAERTMEEEPMEEEPMDKVPMEEETMEEKPMQQVTTMADEQALGSLVRLSRANVPATIPLHQGYYDGESVYFIITDASDQKHADLISENQEWKVELAPLLANAPDDALSTTYMFTDGVVGDGVHGFQGEVFTSTPAQPDMYSGLTSHVHVSWDSSGTPMILASEDEILRAEKEGKLTLEPMDVVINMPQVVWPDGQMSVKADKTLADDTPYGGGQVLDIDLEEMTATFIAHRGWGPDGTTIYYIVTDATPSGPAEMMGVNYAPSSASLIANSAAVDLFQFKNGITGTGPLGFQPGIAASAPGDQNYSPMWRIFFVGWENPDQAALLETIGDINFYKEEGLVDVNIARPMDSDHIVNCPFIDPFQ